MESSPVDAANTETTVELQNISHDIENPSLPLGETLLLGNINSDDDQQQHSSAEQLIIVSPWSSNIRRLLFGIVLFAQNCYFAARQLQQTQEEEDISRALKVVTSTSKVLLPSITLTMVVVIITGQMSPRLLGIPGHNWIISIEMRIQYTAILFMIVGIYQQFRRKRLSKWLQCIAHLLSFDGFLIMGSPWLNFPLRLLPIPLLIVDVILFISFMSM